MNDDQTIKSIEANAEPLSELATLPRVFAPGDFESRVRSKIARGRSKAASGWLVPVSGFASLALILGLGTFIFLWNNEVAPEVSQLPSEQEKNFVQPDRPVASESPSNTFAINDADRSVPVNSGVQRVEVSDTKVLRVPARVGTPVRRSVPQPLGGSIDQAVSSAAKPLGPELTPLQPATNAGSEPVTSTLVSVRDFFQIIGVEASFGSEGWVVDRVVGSSIAAQAGMKKNDVIVSVGSRRLNADTLLEGTRIEQFLEIKREGIAKSIKLGSN